MKIQLIDHLGSAFDGATAQIAKICQPYVDLVTTAHELAPVEISFVPGATGPAPGFMALGLFSNPDVAGALGYHDVDPNGNPYGKAFLSVVPGHVVLHDPSGHGASLAGVVTHELAEVVGDRFANLWAFGAIHDPRSRRRFGAIAFELADPVQDFAFQIDGIDCSDFVFANYFSPSTPATAKTSHTGAAVGPMVITPGGYGIVALEHGETQIFGRRLGEHHERALHDEVLPPAWREAMRALPHSRSSRRVPYAHAA